MRRPDELDAAAEKLAAEELYQAVKGRKLGMRVKEFFKSLAPEDKWLEQAYYDYKREVENT
jgi:hypothetical protein